MANLYLMTLPLASDNFTMVYAGTRHTQFSGWFKVAQLWRLYSDTGVQHCTGALYNCDMTAFKPQDSAFSRDMHVYHQPLPLYHVSLFQLLFHFQSRSKSRVSAVRLSIHSLATLKSINDTKSTMRQ